MLTPSPPDPEVFRRGLQEVRRRLPPGWILSLPANPRPGTSAAAGGRERDARLSGPGGTGAELLAIVCADGSPRSVAAAIERVRARKGRKDSLLLSSFLSDRSRGIAEAAGINYADLTGNIRLVLGSPPLFVRDRGADRNPYGSRKVRRGLGGAAAARVVLRLCPLDPDGSPMPLSGIARSSGVSLSYVSRVVDLLERENLVLRRPRGPIEAVDRPGLLRRWAEDYSLLGSNRGRLYLDPRGVENTLRGMGSPAFQSMRFAVTGSFAARRYAPISSPSKLACFVEDPDAAAGVLGLAAATTSGNVFLLSPCDPGLLEDVPDRQAGPGEDPIRWAPPAQVIVDCLTGPDRMPEEGEAMLEWLRRNRPGWDGLPGEGGG